MEAREELRKLRESTGMNRKEFCEYFEIPYMTETDWELGVTDLMSCHQTAHTNCHRIA